MKYVWKYTRNTSGSRGLHFPHLCGGSLQVWKHHRSRLSAYGARGPRHSPGTWSIPESCIIIIIIIMFRSHRAIGATLCPWPHASRPTGSRQGEVAPPHYVLSNTRILHLSPNTQVLSAPLSTNVPRLRFLRMACFQWVHFDLDRDQSVWTCRRFVSLRGWMDQVFFFSSTNISRAFWVTHNDDVGVV